MAAGKLAIQLQKQLHPVVPWEDITCILWHLDKLFTTVTSNFHQTSSGCNGKIDVWDENLNKIAEFRAHEYGIYHMCAGPGETIYTCASDSEICHWKWEPAIENANHHPESPKELKITKLSLLKGHLEPPWRLQFFRNKLFSADELGEIRLWENDVYKGVMETYEEVWDMVVIPKFIFTVRNIDVTVTSLPDDENRKSCSVKNTIPGKGPLFVSGDRLFLVNRYNNDIMVHSIQEIGNPVVKVLQGHTALINSFVGDETTLFSGDYKGKIIMWDLVNLLKITEISLEENGCVNAMTYKNEKIIYVAQEKKFLSKLCYSNC